MDDGTTDLSLSKEWRVRPRQRERDSKQREQHLKWVRSEQFQGIGPESAKLERMERKWCGQNRQAFWRNKHGSDVWGLSLVGDLQNSYADNKLTYRGRKQDACHIHQAHSDKRQGGTKRLKSKQYC